jgi:hypothetical protein
MNTSRLYVWVGSRWKRRTQVFGANSNGRQFDIYNSNYMGNIVYGYICKMREVPPRAENRFGGRAPWSLFLKFLKFDILKFQKIPGKNPGCSK